MQAKIIPPEGRTAADTQRISGQGRKKEGRWKGGSLASPDPNIRIPQDPSVEAGPLSDTHSDYISLCFCATSTEKGPWRFLWRGRKERRQQERARPI